MKTQPPTYQDLPRPIQAVIQEVSRRLRLQEVVHLTWRTLTIGFALTLLLIIASWFYPLALPLILLVIGIGITGVLLLITWGYALFRTRPLPITARLIDRELNLDERLSTALDLATPASETRPDIIQAQWTDTMEQLSEFDPNETFPLPFSWGWLLTINVLMIAIAVGLLLPNPQVPILQQWLQQQQAIAEQTEQLEEIRTDLLEDTAFLETPEGEETLETLDELIASLQDNALSPEEAIANIAEAEHALNQLENISEKKEQTLNDLAESLNQYNSTSELAEALQQRDAARANEFLQAAAEAAQANPETAQNLAEALQDAAEVAETAGESELAEALQQAAEALGQTVAGQDGAIQGQGQINEEAIQQAAEALAEAQGELGNSEALQEALENIQEAREQLAEATGEGQGEGEGEGEGEGQGNQLGQGQGQSGEGQGQGNGNGDGLGQGGGAGRGEAGEGSSDLYADRPGGELETDNGPNEGRLTEFESDFPPIHWGGEDGPLVNPDPQGATGGLPIGEAPVDPNQAQNPALVPYNEVYGQYNDAASEALEDTYIPRGMKEVVRDYFGALEPGQ